MAEQTLAVKYRPKTFDDVVEQNSIRIILEQQLKSGETKNAYLFCGGAGTGKTTCARIFANEINHGEGNPIEMDAASNSGVDDVRNIIQQAKTKSLTSEYKVFIIDECHAISNTGWQAFLKLIEEPPAKSVFIFCTTDPQKIPKTILSRVQRYDFQRISQNGIVQRLMDILTKEQELGHEESDAILYEDSALDYLAKIADGGMRGAITLLDKCLAYSTYLTMDNVLSALGSSDYDAMFTLTDLLLAKDVQCIILIDKLYDAGIDLKQFVKQYIKFLLDCSKIAMDVDSKYITLPVTEEYKRFYDAFKERFDALLDVLDIIVRLNRYNRFNTHIKADIEADFLLYCRG